LGFEKLAYRNATNKAIILLDICKEQITVFREAAFIANALMAARISFS
jgi:hypothetical protein